MPRDINTLLRKDALMKVDKRSEKYVHQPSRRRRRRPSRRRRQSPRRAEEWRGERACPSHTRAALLPLAAGGAGGGCAARVEGREGGTVAEFTRRHLY